MVVIRKAMFSAAHLVSPVILTRSGGISYYVNTHDSAVSRQVFAAGSYDEGVMSSAMAMLDLVGHPLRGRTFVDVGANIGTSTIPAVATYGASRAIALEPDPFNYQLLGCNVLINGLEERVKTVRVAASDHDGRGLLVRSSWNSGDHRVTPVGVDVPSEPDAAGTIEITLQRLDDVLAEHTSGLGEIGVVWIDCQGHEGYILAGAPALTASDVPIVCEYWPYGLRRTANLDLFHELVADRYAWVVDIGEAATGRGDPHYRLAADVADLEVEYPDAAFTDLLLLKHRPER